MSELIHSFNWWTIHQKKERFLSSVSAEYMFLQFKKLYLFDTEKLGTLSFINFNTELMDGSQP